MKQSESTLDLIERLRREGQSFCIATVVRTKDATSAKPGAKAVITGDGELHGFLGGGCVTGAVRKEAGFALTEGEPRMIRVKPQDEVVAPVDQDGMKLHKSSCPSGGTVEIFLEPMKAQRRLVILGASPIARSLLEIARAVGYASVLGAVDAEDDIAGLAGQSFNAFAEAAKLAGPQDALILSTQGRRDREALRAALESEAGYVAMVASRRKFAALCAEVADSDALRRRAAQIHAPAGLDLKAVEPEEIALSILAEIVAWRRGAGFGKVGGVGEKAAFG